MRESAVEFGDQGFTLVEVMVVAAIIGVISAIAIPNYQIYQARSRQKEATIALSTAYTLMKTFGVENGTYSVCLRQMGYEPPGTSGASSTLRYYFVGFTAGTGGNMLCGGTGALRCDAYSYYYGGTPDTSAICTYGTPPVIGSLTTVSDAAYAATQRAYKTATVDEQTTLATAGCVVRTATFTIGAGGSISARSTAIDVWNINELKQIRNVVNGTN